MPTFNPTNPVEVGGATKKSAYDRLFDNAVAINGGQIAMAAQAAEDDVYAASATQLGRRPRAQSDLHDWMFYFTGAI